MKGNPAVVYNNIIIVANIHGYIDPLQDNTSPGGIMRFDYFEDEGIFKRIEGWPKSGT